MNENALHPPSSYLDAQQQRIEEYRRKIAECSEEILCLTLTAERVREETRAFEHEYHARVGRFYIELDRVQLQVKELLYRARLLEQGFIQSAEQLEKRVREAFRVERHRVEERERVGESAKENAEAESDGLRSDPSSARHANPTKKARRFYLVLAKHYHPDKRQDAETRAQYQRLMAFINQAYEDGDIGTLERLAMTLPERESSPEAPNERERRLYREYLRLHQVVAELRHEVGGLESNATYQLRLDVARGREQGHDPLAELQQEVHGRLDAAKGRFELIQKQFHLLWDRFRGVG